MEDLSPPEEPAEGPEKSDQSGEAVGPPLGDGSTPLIDDSESLPGSIPSPDVRALLAESLQADQTRLGQVYRLHNEGLTPPQIAEQLNVKTHNFVYNYRQLAEALLDGKMPANASMAAQAASRVKGWLKRAGWPDPVRSYLTGLFTRLDSVASDPQLIQQEEAAAALATEKAEKAGVVGAYVYSLPHYLRHRVDPSTQRTYLKVGHSETDIHSRVEHQGRATALPEDLVLLRIYPTSNSIVEEKEFHSWLEAADHIRSRPKREWFLTSTKFLDYVASARGFEPTIVNDDTLAD
jgi:hypothetical protein